MKKNISNQQIISELNEIAKLLEIKETSFRSRAFKKAILILENLKTPLNEIYEKDKVKGLENIRGIGKGIAKDIEDMLLKGKSNRLEELKKETEIQQIIAYFFETKGLSLTELKREAKKQKIVYSRYVKPAKQLLELAGSLEKAKKAIKQVSLWASSRGLDYTIETIFKKWLELDRLKPKEIVKKPFYEGKPMYFSE
ncbi:hypothetical protein FJ208_02440, partial [Candidatus Gribaldobacteria bacterium]|nr:hypothetical protein [Candidatus Gribaldobacteria bacterium]